MGLWRSTAPCTRPLPVRSKREMKREVKIQSNRMMFRMNIEVEMMMRIDRMRIEIEIKMNMKE